MPDFPAHCTPETVITPQPIVDNRVGSSGYSVDNPSCTVACLGSNPRGSYPLKERQTLSLARFELIAIDLDGTLLRPDGSVSRATRAVLAEVIRCGVRVCVATGRTFTESRPILRELAPLDFGVFAGGAMIVDTRAGRAILYRRMASGLVRDVAAFFESAGHAVLALQVAGDQGADYLISDGLPLHPAFVTGLHGQRQRCRKVAPGELARLGD
ncbi:MAG: HAD-IIB family hydrolase, partial [Phycisphaerales bacterium]|nr:HAD-IIB family hydrolase [Phycisphaerales bacterium]